MPSIKIIYMIFIENKQRRFKIMPMKKRLSSSIGVIIILCAIIIISLQKYQPDQEIITTFIREWLNDDSRAETEYKKFWKLEVTIRCYLSLCKNTSSQKEMKFNKKYPAHSNLSLIRIEQDIFIQTYYFNAFPSLNAFPTFSPIT